MSSHKDYLDTFKFSWNKGSWLKFILELPTWKFSPPAKAGQQEFPSGPDIVIFTVCIQGKAFFISIVSQQLNFHFNWALKNVLWHCFNCLYEYSSLVLSQTFSYKFQTSILTFPHSSLIRQGCSKELGFPALSFAHMTHWPTSLNTTGAYPETLLFFAQVNQDKISMDYSFAKCCHKS